MKTLKRIGAAAVQVWLVGGLAVLGWWTTAALLHRCGGLAAGTAVVAALPLGYLAGVVAHRADLADAAD